MPKAKENCEKGSPNVVEGTKAMILFPGVEEEHDHDHGEKRHHHELASYTWMLSKIAIKEVSNIKNQLAKFYPKKAKVFKINAEKYLTKLKQILAD